METYDFFEGATSRTIGFGSAIAQGDDCHDGFAVGDVEQGAEGVGIAHTHDEGVKAHGTGNEYEVGIADAVVVGSPAFANLVSGLALEEAGFGLFVGGDHEDRGSLYIALVEVANQFLNGCHLFGGHGDIVFGGLSVRP